MPSLSVEWCNICNSRPADGTLTVLIDDVETDIDACEVCVVDPTRVEFI